MIADTPKWHQQCITEGIACICKVVLTLWDAQVMNPSTMVHSTIRGTALPPTQDVTEMNVKNDGSKYILGEEALAVAVTWMILSLRLCIDVGTIQCPQCSFKIGKELGVV